ncbi:hypothetical protein RFI_20920 [Reticulomyxa filosa]|uniref:Uncharacterized protein n=1 Tax=Reticulomyxa filosa TaxID=46433 RepID=X6MTJ9_RETFI|nr:hypothetical protein RFI_20920 [Reticulomyxa filosa]|eukprot:ETO16420.1 hypothetical protein RFI_20920 [Reticulomyxa filosa]
MTLRRKQSINLRRFEFLQSSNMQQNEEKKIDKVTFENVWKKNMQKLKSATSVIKFIGLTNKNALSRKILAHTFSGNFRTLFVHFAVDINEQQLTQLAHNFNDVKDGQMEQKENQDGSQDVILIVRHLLLNKRKGEEAVINPEVNRYVLLRGVLNRESDGEIKEALEVKRFHKMPIAKMLLSKTKDVVKILKDNDIQIGYSVVKIKHSTKTNQGQNRISSNAGNATD